MSKVIFNRRRLLSQLGAGASLLALGGCDLFDGVLNTDDTVRKFLAKANALTLEAQRLLRGAGADGARISAQCHPRKPAAKRFDQSAD